MRKEQDCHLEETQLRTRMVAMPRRKRLLVEHFHLLICRQCQRYDSTRRPICHIGVGAMNALRRSPENGRTFAMTVRAIVGSQ